MLGTSFAVLLSTQILPARGDSCGPYTKIYGSKTNIWTPQMLLDSPYLGSATGFSGVSEELDYNFAVTGNQKIDQQGWQASRSGGEAVGIFEVGTWQSVTQQYDCAGDTHTGAQWNGYYVDPATGGTHTTTWQLAPPGTISDANVINQFSYIGFDSMTFDMRYARLDNDFTTPGGAATFVASGDCGFLGCGACGVWYNCTFFNPSVSIGAFGVSGNIEMKYASHQQYDYSYSFPGGWEWYWNYKTSSNFLIAFNFVGPCPGCSGGGDGAGGSPWIGVWDGSQYKFLNNILRTGQFKEGTQWHDVTDYYVLPSTGIVSSGQYQFEVFERNDATDYFDGLALYSVDHPSGTSVVATADQQLITYTNPTPPITAVDRNGTNVERLLSTMNDGTYVTGGSGYSVYLNFGHIESQNAKLIFNATDPVKRSINSYVYASNGTWIPSGTIHPRETWAMEGLNLSNYLQYVKGALKVKLTWAAAGDRVDFVGLDTSSPSQLVVSNVLMSQALYGSQGDVTSILSSTDGNYLVFGPLQVFRATFPVPSPPANLVRDMLLVSTGHYLFP